MSNLYFVNNVGCDDSTRGLVEIPDEYFSAFKTFIENLNKNSLCSCMPVITVYKVSEDQLRLVDPEVDDCDTWKYLYFNDQIYVLKCGVQYLESVIGGDEDND